MAIQDLEQAKLLVMDMMSKSGSLENLKASVRAEVIKNMLQDAPKSKEKPQNGSLILNRKRSNVCNQRLFDEIKFTPHLERVGCRGASETEPACIDKSQTAPYLDTILNGNTSIPGKKSEGRLKTTNSNETLNEGNQKKKTFRPELVKTSREELLVSNNRKQQHHLDTPQLPDFKLARENKVSPQPSYKSPLLPDNNNSTSNLSASALARERYQTASKSYDHLEIEPTQEVEENDQSTCDISADSNNPFQVDHAYDLDF